MSRLIDLTGQRFGRLTVIERAESKKFCMAVQMRLRKVFHSERTQFEKRELPFLWLRFD